MYFKELFFDDSKRLRSGWRFAVFLAALLVGGGAFGAAAVALIYGAGLPIDQGGGVFFAINSLLTLIPTLLVGWLCGKFLEGLPFKALGAWFTKYWFGHFVLGCLIGALTICLAVVIAVVFGGLRFAPNINADTASIARTAALALLVFAVAAAAEEALFRGYILQTFARSGLAWFAIIMTSIFFGLLHFGNPNAGNISTANTMLAGIWFGVAYLKTRDLWFVWALHLVWNWMQGAVFGIEVSGLTDITTAPVLVELDTGPAWLTGGDYGIEGGLACTAALIVSTVSLYFLPISKADPEMLALTGPVETNGIDENQLTSSIT